MLFLTIVFSLVSLNWSFRPLHSGTTIIGTSFWLPQSESKTPSLLLCYHLDPYIIVPIVLDCNDLLSVCLCKLLKDEMSSFILPDAQKLYVFFSRPVPTQRSSLTSNQQKQNLWSFFRLFLFKVSVLWYWNNLFFWPPSCPLSCPPPNVCGF